MSWNSRSSPGHWVRILGADGFHCQADPNDPDTVYAESQYGGLERINVRTGRTVDIRPKAEFQVNQANEAGFDNSAESLAMSPAILK